MVTLRGRDKKLDASFWTAAGQVAENMSVCRSARTCRNRI